MEMGPIFHSNYQVTASGQNAKETKKTGTGKTDSETKLLEAAEMADFRKKFYDDLRRLVPYNTTRDTTLIISEAAFREMKANPEYREKVLSLIQRDWGNFHGSRRYHVLITVGADLKDYRASSWPINTGSGCKAGKYSKRYVRKEIRKKIGKKKREKKVYIEEYIEGKMIIKRLVQILRNEEAANEMLRRRYKELGL
ncbi:MAG: hypothetical protein HDR00_12825 [Lachnospiraceae bacterium]|nr:hypothetical protein [Lachnospiraceae bacterium]